MPSSIETTWIDTVLQENERSVVLYSGICSPGRNVLCGSLSTCSYRLNQIVEEVPDISYPDIEGGEKRKKAE